MQIPEPKHVRRSLAVVAAACLVSACVVTTGGKLEDATVAADTAAMWADGQRSVDAGEALIARGEKRMENARRQIREGEALVNEGNALVAQARDDYQLAAAAAGETLTAAERAATARRLNEIGTRWEAAIAMVRRGNALIEKGNAAIARGQAEIGEGHDLVQAGSVLMRNAQRARLGRKLLPQKST